MNTLLTSIAKRELRRARTLPGHVLYSAKTYECVIVCRQFDLRDPDSFAPKRQSNGSSPLYNNLLINLNAHVGSSAECKCIAVNPVKTHLLALGTNDPFVRLYDRRMLRCRPVRFAFSSPRFRATPEAAAASGSSSGAAEEQEPSRLERARLLKRLTDDKFYALSDDPGAVRYLAPGHLAARSSERGFVGTRSVSCTYVTFSPDGCELLANLGSDQVSLLYCSVFCYKIHSYWDFLKLYSV